MWLAVCLAVCLSALYVSDSLDDERMPGVTGTRFYFPLLFPPFLFLSLLSPQTSRNPFISICNSIPIFYLFYVPSHVLFLSVLPRLFD
ncbi:hypothetical protein F4775DRAFT_566030 [Biscogniauxia sp. FL1348]|nr:hypothetical protein F4775DRAFT_566030 [Biscogniauxia sp. FL1348]